MTGPPARVAARVAVSFGHPCGVLLLRPMLVPFQVSSCPVWEVGGNSHPFPSHRFAGWLALATHGCPCSAARGTGRGREAPGDGAGGPGHWPPPAAAAPAREEGPP